MKYSGKTHIAEFVPVFALVVLGHGAHPLIVVQRVSVTAAGNGHRQNHQRHEQTETQHHLRERERAGEIRHGALEVKTSSLFEFKGLSFKQAQIIKHQKAH